MQKTLNKDTDGEDDNGCDGGSGDVQEEHGSRSTGEDFAVMWRRIFMRLTCLILTLMETSTPPGRQWPQCAGVLT